MYIWTEIGLLPVTYAILSSALLCANALMCLIDYSCESALRIILCLDCLAQCKSSYRQWDVMKWFLILFYCYIRKLSWNEIFYCSRNGFCYLISFFLLSHYSCTTRKSFIILFGVDWLVWLTIVTLKRKKWLSMLHNPNITASPARKRGLWKPRVDVSVCAVCISAFLWTVSVHPSPSQWCNVHAEDALQKNRATPDRWLKQT